MIKAVNTLGDLLFTAFTFFLGVIIAGQFLLPSAAFWFGIIAAAIMLTKSYRWGPFDMLLLRRLIVIVGISTLLAIHITGIIFTTGIVGVSTSTILLAGMHSIPVYVTMTIAFLVTLVFHYWQINHIK